MHPQPNLSAHLVLEAVTAKYNRIGSGIDHLEMYIKAGPGRYGCYVSPQGLASISFFIGEYRLGSESLTQRQPCCAGAIAIYYIDWVDGPLQPVLMKWKKVIQFDIEIDYFSRIRILPEF